MPTANATGTTNGAATSPATRWPGNRLFGSLLALVLGLQLVAIHAQSLSGDGAYHLLAGHQALRYGQNLLNLEHPPLAKLVMALPLLALDEPLSEPVTVDRALAASEGLFERPETIRTATILGRSMLLLVFVGPLLWSWWRLGCRWGNEDTGRILVVMLGLSFSVLPNLAVLQTDSAVSLGFALVLLAGARLADEGSWWATLLLGLALGFAVAVKYSGVLLVPAALVAWLPAARRNPRRLVALAQLALLAVTAYLTVDLTYAAANWRYDAALGRETISTYCEGRGTLVVRDQLAAAEGTLLAVEAVQPRLAQWLTGFLGIRIQNRLGIYPSYAFGSIDYQGRWWYFPVLFLVKTPLAVLVALAVAAAVAIRRRTRSDGRIDPTLPAVVLAVYGCAAVTSNYNLGVRHLMPILPLLYLPAARLLAERRRLALGVVTALCVEALLVSPFWMSQTNTWMLGAANPTRFALGAGNLEYRQNLVQLARYAERHGLEDLTVVYPPLAPPAVQAYLPGARVLQPGDPLDPGWYAVNVRLEQYIPAIERSRVSPALEDLGRAWSPIWDAIRTGEDHGWIAATFHLYRLEEAEP